MDAIVIVVRPFSRVVLAKTSKSEEWGVDIGSGGKLLRRSSSENSIKLMELCWDWTDNSSACTDATDDDVVPPPSIDRSDDDRWDRVDRTEVDWVLDDLALGGKPLPHRHCYLYFSTRFCHRHYPHRRWRDAVLPPTRSNSSNSASCIIIIVIIIRSSRSSALWIPLCTMQCYTINHFVKLANLLSPSTIKWTEMENVDDLLLSPIGITRSLDKKRLGDDDCSNLVLCNWDPMTPPNISHGCFSRCQTTYITWS